MKHSSATPSVFRAALLFLLMVGLSAGSAWAQDQPEYAAQYKTGIQAAKQAQQLEQAGNLQEASGKYAESYNQLASAADAAEEAGDLKNSDTMRRKAAQIAYKAGQMLYKDGQSQPAITHFEAGKSIDASFQGNQKGLTAARGKLKSGPLVDGSQALNAGNPAEAIRILQDAEDTGKKFFYLANAYLQTRDFSNVINAATQAFAQGGLSGSNTAQLFLIRGEAYMQSGDKDKAIADLEQAQRRGRGAVSDRAAGLIDQLGS